MVDMICVDVAMFRFRPPNSFIAINDGSTLGNLQCVVDFETLEEDTLKTISTGAVLKITGNFIESQGKGQHAEIQVTELHVYGTVDPETYPIQPKKHSFEFLREKAHLRVRTATFSAVMRVRAALAFAVHQFFRDQGFRFLFQRYETSFVLFLYIFETGFVNYELNNIKLIIC